MFNWIIDSGATDDITNSLESIMSYRKVFDIIVHLPNGFQILVTIVGTVQLNDSLLLTYVLFVPMFSFSLISASKIIYSSNICLIFYNHFLFIQDIKNWRMTGLAKKQQGLYHLILRA